MSRSVKFYSREVQANPFEYVGSVSMARGDVDYEAQAKGGFGLRYCEVLVLSGNYAYTFHVAGVEGEQ